MTELEQKKISYLFAENRLRNALKMLEDANTLVVNASFDCAMKQVEYEKLLEVEGLCNEISLFYQDELFNFVKTKLKNKGIL